MTNLRLVVSAAAFMLALPALAQVDLSLLPEESSQASSSSSSEIGIEISNSALSSASEPSSAEPSSYTSSSEPDEGISNPEIVTPQDSAAMMQVFFDTCTSLSGGDPAAFDKANDAGWVPYDNADYGPYKRVYAGSREFAGYGAVEVWGSFETYPTQSLGYCRMDFSDPEGTFDFNAVAGIGGLSGTVSESGLNGVWESEDKKLLVIAANYDTSIAIEFNVLVGDTPAQ